jgi:hypothetical protein
MRAAFAPDPISNQEAAMQGMRAWLIPILTVAVAMGACATQGTRAAQPAVPIKDVASLSGQWRGWYIGAAGDSQPLVVDVSPDGTYRSRIGSMTGIGTFKVEDGKIVTTGHLFGSAAPFERTAVATLSERNGRPVITGQGHTSLRPYSFEIVKE